MTASKKSRQRLWNAEERAAALWRRYSTEEDKARTNLHYDQPAEFFTTITGGEWHCYSCNLWEGAASETESQELKLDLLAHLMNLQPGQRILDVGCGWGGPLVYLASRYGVRGVGLTLSPSQREYAQRRAEQHRVGVEIHECHWRDFTDAGLFDAVYTDEVTIHFNDIREFFDKARALLKPGGRLLNKEMYLTSSRYKRLTRGLVFLNEIAGETGNPRTLHEELAQLDQAGFTLERIVPVASPNYLKTFDWWLGNMERNRRQLEALVGREYYRRFRTYLRLVRRVFAGPTMTVEIVVSRSPA